MQTRDDSDLQTGPSSINQVAKKDGSTRYARLALLRRLQPLGQVIGLVERCQAVQSSLPHRRLQRSQAGIPAQAAALWLRSSVQASMPKLGTFIAAEWEAAQPEQALGSC